ncbi:MAG: hypothetical protein ABI337_03255 [Nitrososphaera sp.]|jgi:hypothetical protein
MYPETQRRGQIIKDIFSKPLYLVTSVAVFSVLVVSMLNARQFLFFEPYLVFQLPEDLLPDFSLIVAVSALSAFVLSIAFYQIREFRAHNKVGTGVAGSLMGAGAGVCTACGSVGIFVVSTFGVVGATALSLIEIYEIPIRLAAVGILAITSALMIKNISAKCRIQNKHDN